MKYFALGLSMVVLLSSCAGMQNQSGKKGQLGAVGGAATGAVLGQAVGKNTESTLIGTTLGTVLGYVVGNEMDKQGGGQVEQQNVRNVQHNTTAWKVPGTGN